MKRLRSVSKDTPAMIHRVRSVIPLIQYTNVRNVIPKDALFSKIPNEALKDAYPVGVKNYPLIGLFVDTYIRMKLLQRANPLQKMKEPFQIYIEVAYAYGQRPDNLQKSLQGPYIKQLDDFIDSIPAKEFTVEPEWEADTIQGHPDIILDDVIVDVKMTKRFSQMRTETILQLLCYWCLGKQNGSNATSIGLLLPAQRLYTTVNLQKWDWKPFWKIIVEAAAVRMSLLPSPSMKATFQSQVLPYVGSHVAKTGTIAKTIEACDSKLPWQLFLFGNFNRGVLSEKDLTEANALVQKKSYRIYIHSPYSINISSNHWDNYPVRMLKEQLRYGRLIGCKGVVVHCGKRAESKWSDSFDMMVKNFSEAALDSTPECTLLLETSAGQDGEMCSSLEDLIFFWHCLEENIQKRVAICLDTAHVHGAGFCPMEFLDALEKEKIPVKLVHFNDSKVERGRCLDRHCRVGCGYIGLEKMTAVGQWSLQRKIDMVIE